MQAETLVLRHAQGGGVPLLLGVATEYLRASLMREGALLLYVGQNSYYCTATRNGSRALAAVLITGPWRTKAGRPYSITVAKGGLRGVPRETIRYSQRQRVTMSI